MKDKLISAIREVPISGKTYEEYIEALADKLIAEDYRKASEVVREIFEEIEKLDRRPIPESKAVYVIKESEFAELKKKYTEEGK